MDITVGIGEIKVVGDSRVLKAIALGSCVAVALYDRNAKIGALAHIVLPYIKEGFDKARPTRYADVAISMMIDKMKRRGARIQNVKAKIFGGANMFPEIIPPESEMNIGKWNIIAVKEELKRYNISIVAEEVGGNSGRTLLFDTRDDSVTAESENMQKRRY